MTPERCRAPRASRAAWAAVLAAVLGAATPAYADPDDAALCTGARQTAEQAITRCTSAIESGALGGDRLAAIYVRRGLAWFARGDLERSSADLDAAIGLDGRSSWAYNARAVVWMQRGQVDRAIADYDSAVRMKPDYAFALSNRGNAWLVRGDADRALADLDAAIRLSPPQIELALTGRGRAWLAKGDFERGRADFDAALTANPKYANALSGRAYARFCLGAFDAAAADFAQERRIRPDSESSTALVIARLRAGYDGKGEIAEAVKSLDTGNGLPPGLALFAGALTPEQALQAAGDRDPGLARLRACQANFEVGEWYLLRKDTNRARRHLSAARDRCDRSRAEFGAAGAELARLPR